MKKALSTLLAVFIALFAFAACEKKDKDGDAIIHYQRASVTETTTGTNRTTYSWFEPSKLSTVAETTTAVITTEIKETTKAVVTTTEAVTTKTTQAATADGERVKASGYSIVVPNGWTSAKDSGMFILTKSGTETQVIIKKNVGVGINEVNETHRGMLKIMVGDVTISEKTEKIAGKDADIVYLYTPYDGVETYFGCIALKNQATVYSVLIVSPKKDFSWSEIVSILNTMEF